MGIWRQDGQDASDRRLTARTVPDDDRLPIGAAGEPDQGDIVLPTAEQTIWKGRYCGMRSFVICNLIRQIASRTMTSMPTIVTQNQHRAILPRSEAINAKKIVPITATGKSAPAIQITDIKGSSPLSVPSW